VGQLAARDVEAGHRREAVTRRVFQLKTKGGLHPDESENDVLDQQRANIVVLVEWSCHLPGLGLANVANSRKTQSQQQVIRWMLE
jgi:hypothetical protein